MLINNQVTVRQKGGEFRGRIARGPSASRTSTPSIPTKFETVLLKPSNQKGFGSSLNRFTDASHAVQSTKNVTRGNPGPGHYMPDAISLSTDGHVYSKKGYGVGFVSKAGRRGAFERGYSNSGPGPGSYFHVKNLMTSTIGGFAVGAHIPTQTQTNEEPMDPNAYLFQRDQALRRNRSAMVKPRIPTAPKENPMLGPGRYEPEKTHARPLSGAFDKAEKGYFRLVEKAQFTPAPNQYPHRPFTAKTNEFHVGPSSSFFGSVKQGIEPPSDPHSKDGLRIKSAKFFKQKEQDSSPTRQPPADNEVPGPGTYFAENHAEEEAELSMRLGKSTTTAVMKMPIKEKDRLNLNGRDLVLNPGPGTYISLNTQSTFLRQKLLVAQSAFMSESTRLNPMRLENTGPSTYDPLYQSKKVSFHRNQHQKWI